MLAPRMAPDAMKHVDASEAIQLPAFRTDQSIVRLTVGSHLTLHTCQLFQLAVSQLALFNMIPR